MTNKRHIACSLLLSFGLTHLSANVSATDGKTNFCENESVSVSYTGQNPSSPGPSCCNGQGSWVEDGVATYSWSGDASGAGISATLDTSTAGSKTASVVVTQDWKCSEGSETGSTTKNGSGSFTVNPGPAYDGSNPCSPPELSASANHSHGNVAFSGGSKTETESYFPFIQVTYTFQAGTISSVKHSIIPVADGSVTKSSSCGQGLGTINKVVSGWSGVSFSVSLPVGISLGGSWSGSGDTYAIFDKADAGAQSGKWKFGQAYKINWRLDSGKLTASGSSYNHYSNVTTPITYENEPVTLAVGPELHNWDYTVCGMCCSY